MRWLYLVVNEQQTVNYLYYELSIIINIFPYNISNSNDKINKYTNLPLFYQQIKERAKLKMNTSRLGLNTHHSKCKSVSRQGNGSPLKNGCGGQMTTRSPSPKKGGKISQDLFVMEMKKMREKLCNTIDAYILIFETNAPLRCLEHNSVLSLYCQTEQKLLCANCIFRNGLHKQHKIFPIDKCFKQIVRDIDQMSRQAERQILWANNTLHCILQYVKNQQKLANEATLNLAQLYQQLQYQLSRSFEQAKRKILHAMDNVFYKKQPLLLQLQYFKQLFAKNKPPSFGHNAGMLQRQEAPMTQTRLIYEHLIGCSLLEYSKMQGNKLVENTSRVKMVQKKQVEKINSLIFLLKKFNSPEKNQKY